MTRPRLPLLLLLLLPVACTGSSEGGGMTVTGAVPARVENHNDSLLLLSGAGLRRVRRVMLWAGTDERLEQAVALERPQARSDAQLEVRLPAGALPGHYRVVLQGGDSTLFSEARVQVTERARDEGPPAILRTAGGLYSDVPGRIYAVGANLRGVRAARLAAGGRTHALSRLRVYSAARVGASLAGGVAAPGEYRLQLENAHGWSDGALVRVSHSGHGQEAGLTFGVYFGVLGAVFLVGLTLAWRQGDVGLSGPVRRRNLLLLLGGLAFYLVLLGSVQFLLSGWS